MTKDIKSDTSKTRQRRIQPRTESPRPRNKATDIVENVSSDTNKPKAINPRNLMPDSASKPSSGNLKLRPKGRQKRTTRSDGTASPIPNLWRDGKKPLDSSQQKFKKRLIDVTPQGKDSGDMDDDETLEANFANAADPVALGEAVRTARLNAGLSQSQLEAKSNVSIWNISKIERGGGGTLQNMEKIAEATDTQLKIGFVPKVK